MLYQTDMNSYNVFKGIRQVLLSTYTALTSSEKEGMLWLVRNDTATTVGDIYFGTRKYAEAISTDRFILKPDVLYQYTGGTQIYGSSSSSLSNTWQLTNLDLSKYKYLKATIKSSDYASDNGELTPPLIVTIPLDSGVTSSAATIYMGSAAGLSPNDQNKWVVTLCAVDSTKTKFQIVNTRSIYGTVGTNKANNGRYLFKLEGWYDLDESGGIEPATITRLSQLINDCGFISGYTETDPTLSAHTSTTVVGGTSSQKHLPTVTSSDNNKVLMVVNGEWALTSPSVVYSGSGAPDNTQGNNGDIYIQTS